MPKIDLLYPELSYAIIGILFDIYNDLGYGYQEKYYQRAFKVRLKEAGIPYSRELASPIQYRSLPIGRYIVDFLIDKKVVVEMKVSRKMYKRQLVQLLAYLKQTNTRLGILAVFTPEGLIFERVAN